MVRVGWKFGKQGMKREENEKNGTFVGRESGKSSQGSGAKLQSAHTEEWRDKASSFDASS